MSSVDDFSRDNFLLLDYFMDVYLYNKTCLLVVLIGGYRRISPYL